MNAHGLFRVKEWPAIWLLVCLLVPAVSEAEDRENVIESFEVARDGRLLLVPIYVDDKRYMFALDTGSTISIFDPVLQAAFDWTNGTAQMNGKDIHSIWKSSRALIGERRVPLVCRALCIDLKDFRDASCQDVWGILGMDFLAPHIVEIDCDSGRVSFLRTTNGVEGRRVKLDMSRSGVPAIPIDLPGGTTMFTIDTAYVGVSNGTLSKRLFTQMLEAEAISVSPGAHQSLTIDGPIEGRTAIVRFQSVDGMRHERPLFDEGVSNLIGLGYLSRFTITFDFVGNAIYLKPGRRFSAVLPANRLGIDIKISNQLPVFTDVQKGGSGWQAGIRQGDVLVAVDGKESRAMTLLEIVDRMCRDPRPMQLQIADPASGATRNVIVKQEMGERHLIRPNVQPRRIVD